MWCLTAPGVVVHRIRNDKSAATFTALVGDYHGTIVADALGTHQAGARDGPGIVLAGCWAHAFRRFDEAKADHPDAEQALAWIGALYDIDRRGDGDLARIGELRRTDAPAILAPFREWLLARAGDNHLSIGKAAAYTLGIWERLTLFADDARIPLDNNATERAIRGPVDPVSLCSSFSNARNRQRAFVLRISTRATATLRGCLTRSLPPPDPDRRRGSATEHQALSVVPARSHRGSACVSRDSSRHSASRPRASSGSGHPSRRTRRRGLHVSCDRLRPGSPSMSDLGPVDRPSRLSVVAVSSGVHRVAMSRMIASAWSGRSIAMLATLGFPNTHLRMLPAHASGRRARPHAQHRRRRRRSPRRAHAQGVA